MTLRLKLLSAQLPLALALVLMGFLSVRTTQYLGSNSQAILKDNYRSVLACERMKEALERIDSANVFVALGEAAKGSQQREENVPRFEAELAVQEGNLTEVGEAEATHQLRAAWTNYLQLIPRLAAMTEPAEQKRYYFGTLEQAFLRIKALEDQILDMNQDAMVRKSEQAKRSAQRVDRQSVAATLAALLLGLIASSSLTSRLLRPLSVLTQAARRIGQGDLEARAVVAGRDEVADLAREFNEMADHLKHYRASSLGELLQAQNAAQSAIDSLPDAVVVFNADKTVLTTNHLAEQELQIDLNAGGVPLARVVPDLRSAMEQARDHVLAGRGAYQPRGFEDAVRTDGPEGERYLLPRATPVHTEAGAVSGATVVLQDVTRLRRFDELKNDLVATVAHEFRTPLTSLRMAIHLCLEGAAGPLTDKQSDLLGAGRQDCERLQSIVDDLLDLSRMQAGKVELNRQTVAASTLAETAIDQMRALAQDKQVELSLEDLADAVELSVDPERMGLVFSNLLTNAIRYTPPLGKVVVRSLPGPGVIRFEVSDRGPGIPPEYRERIFEKYFRIPGAPSGSAGLGLYISREIINAHGGEIGVESEVGKGSTFWFTVPLPGPNATGPSSPHLSPGA
jgi:signal transduction histidine kinase